MEAAVLARPLRQSLSSRSTQTEVSTPANNTKLFLVKTINITDIHKGHCAIALKSEQCEAEIIFP